MEIDVAEWADKWQKINSEYDGSMRDRPKVGIQFAIDLIRAVIAADKSRGRYADIDDAFNEQPPPGGAGEVLAHASDRTVGREDQNKPAPTKDFMAHLRRRAEREPAVKAALESRDDEQPAPAPAGDVPEWFRDIVRQAWSAGRNMFPQATSIEGVAWQIAESEITRRVAEATKESRKANHQWVAEANKLQQYLREEIGSDGSVYRTVFDEAISILKHWHKQLTQRDAENERLKAQLTKWESEPVGKLITEVRDEERESKHREIAKLKAELAEAKKRALPAGWEMSGTMVSRQDECERLTKENATLREQLAEATKPVEDAKTLFATDANGTTFLAVYEVDFRRERAARLAAERRLALTREAWRHRWVSRDGELGPKLTPLTDTDIDAAIAAHQKSKETSNEAI